MSENKKPSAEKANNQNMPKKRSFFWWSLDINAKDLLDFRHNTQEEIDKLNEEMTTTNDLDDIIKQTRESESNRNINPNKEKDEEFSKEENEEDTPIWGNDLKQIYEPLDSDTKANKDKQYNPIEWEIVEDPDKSNDEENEENKPENGSDEHTNIIEESVNIVQESENNHEEAIETKEKKEKVENENVNKTKDDKKEDKIQEPELWDSAKFFDPFELDLEEDEIETSTSNDEILNPFWLNDEENDEKQEIINQKDGSNKDFQDSAPNDTEQFTKLDNFPNNENEDVSKNTKEDNEINKENDALYDEELWNNNEDESNDNEDESDDNEDESEDESDDIEDESDDNEDESEDKSEDESDDNEDESEDKSEDESDDNEDESEDESDDIEDESEDESDDIEDESDDESDDIEDESDDESDDIEDESDDESESDEEFKNEVEEENNEKNNKDKKDETIINTTAPITTDIKDENKRSFKDKKTKKNSATWEIITKEEIQLEQWQDVPINEDNEEYQPTAEELFEYEPEFFANDELSQQLMHLIQNVRGIFKLERKDWEENTYFKILWWKTENSTLEYLFYLIETEDEPIDLYIKKVETDKESWEENEHLVQFSYNKDKELNIFVDEIILYEKINKYDTATIEYNDTKSILEKFIFLTDNHYDKLKAEIDKQHKEKQKRRQLQQIFKGF